jgi:2,3,4,5-tetrahydropyridine-2-carboxylate N-succinyltransferase
MSFHSIDVSVTNRGSAMVIQRTGHRYRDTETGKTVDVWFPSSGVRKHRHCLAEKIGLIAGDFVEVAIESLDTAPVSTEDAYLRLHLLSERTVKPNQINLEGIFRLLPNVAWTSAGPVLPGKVDELRDCVAPDYHHLIVFSVDRFPRMTDYVVPEGVRIGDADRVRLGAHLAAGTTVMHEGFVNFNAGTLGRSMVEGRITPGVTVGKDSDVGAGSSIMGTLSGGGKTRNSIGERSLLGANAGIGISLGDECIVEAGLYVTAGTKVKTPDGSVVAARQLSGHSGLLFRRNSQTGAVEVLATDSSRWGSLNATLHGND